MNKKILIIDDEKLITDSLLKLLKKQDYEVEIAHNGTKALELVKTNEFNLIVSDIRMPDINGIDTIKKIREHLKYENKTSIPEILITGYASQENLKEAEQLAVADYIYKPFNVKEFLDIVKKNLK